MPKLSLQICFPYWILLTSKCTRNIFTIWLVFGASKHRVWLLSPASNSTLCLPKFMEVGNLPWECVNVKLQYVDLQTQNWRWHYDKFIFKVVEQRLNVHRNNSSTKMRLYHGIPPKTRIETNPKNRASVKFDNFLQWDDMFTSPTPSFLRYREIL